MYFTRLVLGVQLVLAGVQLPGRYLQTEWKSLTLLLGPGMTAMWLCSSLLIWGLVPNISFLQALAVGACVTPTDPVLSNSIVKGKFADKNVPRPLQRIIVAESGANDGLGYPFLFIALYLLKYVHHGGQGFSGGTGKAIAMWFYETWCYEILLSIAYGIVVGWLAMKLLHWAEEKKYVDRESFLVFAISLGLFIMGTCGLIGTDDLLACFIAGNVFTQDDWFRLETMDDSLQPTVDMLLNLAIFMWFGAVCPWASFADNDIIPLYRLVILGILILIFRRLPIVLAMHKYIHQIEHLAQAAFVGFFGPIGVGAIFYLSVSRQFLAEQVLVDGKPREDAQKVADTTNIVVWFLVICSIIVHGLSVPLGKAGYHLPRTISSALSNSSTIEPEPISLPSNRPTHSTATPTHALRFYRGRKRGDKGGREQPPTQTVFRIGRSTVRERSPAKSPPETMPTTPAPVQEPDRPVRLVGEDGHVTETLHSTAN
ncbi:Na/H antiporter [Rasamsonia emersonii CBS 393.64]|uniref:Na/H antiporter n=1 Tax=Rasamsonia emersonii (strain ATCC 16479 / CBS 393.64 / IMI 116815) TaxID=1408163 RepID=A0A0F4YQG7_RASE3|nr:Na/H antiporter [Rasamsonia emersonii CBS 393.64]KKA20499.1 Na/H antiporter [Rasamsonia emersonii CBS 393.64]